MSELESNFARAYKMESAFINGLDWTDVATELDRATGITKQDIVAWANKNMPAEGYCVVYKRQGEDKSQKKINKPAITPISANRDAQSDYLLSIQQSEVKPIEPQFLNFKRDMGHSQLDNGVEVLYKRNTTNELFSLIFLYDFGTTTVKSMALAADYIKLLGTDEKSAVDIQRELYDLACDFQIIAQPTKTYLIINGLSENMEAAIKIVENYLSNVVGDEDILREVKRDAIQQRINDKSSQQQNFYALQSYCVYGADYIRNKEMSNKELNRVSSEELLSVIKQLSSIKYRILYYGPNMLNDLIGSLYAAHRPNENLRELHSEPVAPKEVKEPMVTFAQYDVKQVYYLQYSCRAKDKFDIENLPVGSLYCSYFSGGMNSIVFQEMREARGLAYSAYTYLARGSVPQHPYHFYAFIATQNDKVQQAVEAFDEIIENMSRSEKAFELAKSGLLANLESQRITKSGILWHFIEHEKFGLQEDSNKTLYEGIQSLTLDDVVKFQQDFIKGRKYNYCILGDKNDLDMKYLRSLGKVKFVSQEEIFGY